MRFHEFQEDKGSTLASRTISRYADEIGPDSMDYKMFKKSAELLDAGKIKITGTTHILFRHITSRICDDSYLKERSRNIQENVR